MPKDFKFRGRDPMDKRLASEVKTPEDQWRHAKKPDGTTMCGMDPDVKPTKIGSLGMCLDCLAECFKDQTPG